MDRPAGCGCLSTNSLAKKLPSAGIRMCKDSLVPVSTGTFQLHACAVMLPRYRAVLSRRRHLAVPTAIVSFDLGPHANEAGTHALQTVNSAHTTCALRRSYTQGTRVSCVGEILREPAVHTSRVHHPLRQPPYRCGHDVTWWHYVLVHRAANTPNHCDRMPLKVNNCTVRYADVDPRRARACTYVGEQ